VVTVAGHGDMTVEDLLGSYAPLPDGGVEFVHGPLVAAYRRLEAATWPIVPIVLEICGD
jgi:MoxR-like ATPase